MECVVHGGDFTILGFEEDVQKLAKVIAQWFEIKVRGMLGLGPL